MWRLIAGRLPYRAVGLLVEPVYGLGVMANAKAIILPERNSPLLEFPIWHFALAYLLYGVTMGWLMSRAGEEHAPRMHGA